MLQRMEHDSEISRMAFAAQMQDASYMHISLSLPLSSYIYIYI